MNVMRHEFGCLRVLASALALGLMLLLLGCAGVGVAVHTGVAPPIDWQLNLTHRHMLIIHNGPNGVNCPTVPPQADCAWRVPGRREFYIRYVSPNSSRVLVAFSQP